MDYKNLFDISGKVVIITGTSTGIGLSLCRGFLTLGAKVVATSRSAYPEKESLQPDFIPLDLSRHESANALVDYCLKKHGRVDAFVGNAGTGEGGKTLEANSEDWDRVINTNLRTNFFLTQRVVKEMIANKIKGSIVHVSSVLALIGHPEAAIYNTSKGGLLQLTRSFAVDFGKYGIRVNTLAPGFIATPLVKDWMENEEAMKRTNDKIPLGRPGMPDEMVGPVAFLVSDASSFLTGSVLVADGGDITAAGYSDQIFGKFM